jgi:SAM-dependent methyltransferase
VGLGRYGDPLDPEGDLKAINELKRVVVPGGSLLFVVPVGRAVIQFNAHRVYAYRQVVEAFSGFALRQFALIPESPARGGLVYDATEEMSDAERYACGCFWFTRLER